MAQHAALAARHDLAGRRHFAAARRKEQARAEELEKTASAICLALDTRHRAALWAPHWAKTTRSIQKRMVYGQMVVKYLAAAARLQPVFWGRTV